MRAVGILRSPRREGVICFFVFFWGGGSGGPEVQHYLFFLIPINGVGNVVSLSKQNPTNCLSLISMGGHLFLLNLKELHVILSFFMDIHSCYKFSIEYFIGSILFPCSFPNCSLSCMDLNYFRTHQQNPRSPANVPLTGKRPAHQRTSQLAGKQTLHL